MKKTVFRLGYSARMSAKDSDTGEVMLYGEIVQDYGKAYKEYFPDDKSASDFDKAIKALKRAGAKNLLLRINSPGGIVYEAVAMRSILENAGFDRMTVRVEGLCASAATILATVSGAEVEIAPGSEYMIHNPWTVAVGNAEDMEDEAAHLRQMEGTIRAFYSRKTGQDDDQIREWMDEEKWFTADQAVEYGFADRLTEGSGAVPAAASVTREQMAVMRELYNRIPDAVTEAAEEDEGDAGRMPEATPEGAKDEPRGEAATDSDQPTCEEEAPPSPKGEAPEEEPIDGSTLDPVAGSGSSIEEKEETHMDLKELTVEMLREGNPALLDAIADEALKADQERRDEIDELTFPGYEDMAEEAKRTRMSAMDFHKAVAKAQREKAKQFISDRVEETAPALDIAGGEADGARGDAESEEAYRKHAEEAKAYAMEAVTTGRMF